MLRRLAQTGVRIGQKAMKGRNLDQIKTLWDSFDLQRRLIIGGATLAVVVGVLLVGRSAVNPDFALLYSGLDPAAAGDVVAALEQQGTPYRITGGAIHVPATDRDRLRMVLAGEGLPATGGAGYELLDSLSGFGTTSQMFDAAYWRAKEGELARTMMANPGIRSARVHISNVTSRPFQREAQISASVHIVPAGLGLTAAQARALRYLVASAVSGLGSDQVTVIDGTTGEMIEPLDATRPDRRSEDHAQELRNRLERLLAAHVGTGKALVEVNVDVVSESETIVERRFDPTERVAISSDITERESANTGAASGAVSVASNLPDGDAAPGGSTAQSSDKEARERINYEVSETTREVVRTPGSIRRLTVAVLVDGVTDPATGAWQARPDTELQALEALVASAIGFDAARGDSITIRSLQLDTSRPPIDQMPDPGWLTQTQLNLTSVLQALVFAVLTLAIALLVLRPVLLGRRRSAPAPDRTDPVAAIGDAQLPPAALGIAPVEGAAQLGGPRPAADAPPAMPEAAFPQMAVSAFGFADDPQPAAPVVPIPVDAEAVARLKALISERREETLEVLRGWMEGPEDRDGERAK